jgi:hypothetical protein
MNLKLMTSLVAVVLCITACGNKDNGAESANSTPVAAKPGSQVLDPTRRSEVDKLLYTGECGVRAYTEVEPSIGKRISVLQIPAGTYDYIGSVSFFSSNYKGNISQLLVKDKDPRRDGEGEVLCVKSGEGLTKASTYAFLDWTIAENGDWVTSNRRLTTIEAGSEKSMARHSTVQGNLNYTVEELKKDSESFRGNGSEVYILQVSPSEFHLISKSRWGDDKTQMGNFIRSIYQRR